MKTDDPAFIMIADHYLDIIDPRCATDDIEITLRFGSTGFSYLA